MAYPIATKTYRHTKTGRLYYVVGLAEHTETGEAMVVYRQVGNPKLLVRPMSGEDGWTTPGRFELVEAPNA